MKTNPNSMKLRASVIAVHGALAVMALAPAHAAEPTVDELTKPAQTIEVGVGAANEYAAKANEYSGLDSKKAHLIANIDLRGGGAYDSDSATRWSVEGARLGTKSPSLEATYGVQGRYRLKLGFDQLLRNDSDTFQTPYQASGNRFTLPSNWIVPTTPQVNATSRDARGLSSEVSASPVRTGGALVNPTPAQAATSAALQAADLPAYHSVDLFTKRTAYQIGYERELGNHWGFSLGLSREHKEGLKALSVHMGSGGDAAAVLPAPIDQDDNKFNVGASYTDARFQMQVGYEGSSFRNNIDKVVWDPWSITTTPATADLFPMVASTAPDNQFHKLSLSSAWRLADATRLVGHASYARGTQDQAYDDDASTRKTATVIPVSSAQAKVIFESVGVKLFQKMSPALDLSAGYKFDKRDNRTPVNTYLYYDNTVATGTSVFAGRYPGAGTNSNINDNTPYSKRSQQLDLEADYKLAPEQHVKGGVRTEKAARYCNGTWINCADATDSHEHTLHGAWFGNINDEVSARFSVAGSRRRVTYDENAFLAVVPMAQYTPTGAPAGSSAYQALQLLGLTGWGPNSGLTPAFANTTLQGFYFPTNSILLNTLYGNRNRFSELPGLRRYNQANRNRGKFAGSLTWQASERTTLQGGVDLTDDHYGASRYGLQRVQNSALNLDASYAASEDISVSVFASYEEQRQRSAGNTYTANSAATNVAGATVVSGGCYTTIAARNATAKIDPCLDWSAKMHDITTTLGTSFKLDKLMGGRVDLAGSASYSRSRTAIDVSGGSYVNNQLLAAANNPASAIASYYVAATGLPVNTVKSFDLRLGGTYHLNAANALRLAYGYQRLAVADWGYDGYQPGGPSAFLPTFEQAPHYRVHSVGISFIATLR